MRKRILAYIDYMNARLEKLEKEYNGKGQMGSDLEKVKAEHLNQIMFFQHERLIHLIVTVLFAVLEFLALFLCLMVPNIGTFLLTAAVMILLIPYIRHYYLLENEVQKMYDQYDRLQGLIDNESFKN